MAAGVATVIGKPMGHALASVSQDMTVVDTTQRNALGMMVQDDLGNEYVYAQGIGSTVAGSWVFLTNATGQYITQLSIITGALGGRVGVALAAVLASQFGWYAIKHTFVFGICISDTFLVNSGCFLTSTAGSVDDESGGAGTTIYGAVNRTLGTTTSSNFDICYPYVTSIDAA